MVSDVAARDKLIDAAERCFEAYGIAASGISDLIMEAGVARMSLYNNFSSKDDLVVAYLERRHEEWVSQVQAKLADIVDHRQRILAVVAEYGWRVNREEFRGCVFVNAAAELPADHPGWEVIHKQKRGVVDLLVSLARDAEVDNPQELAEELFLLAEGAIVTAGIQRSVTPLATAENAATHLVSRHLPD